MTGNAVFGILAVISLIAAGCGFWHLRLAWNHVPAGLQPDSSTAELANTRAAVECQKKVLNGLNQDVERAKKSLEMLLEMRQEMAKHVAAETKVFDTTIRSIEGIEIERTFGIGR